MHTWLEISKSEKDKISKFLGLVCLTDVDPDVKTVIRGYLAFYEKFSPKQYLLDTIHTYLTQRILEEEIMTYAQEFIHYYYLRNDFRSIAQFVTTYEVNEAEDVWTNYRIGEAYYNLSDYNNAFKYFEIAVNKKKFNLDFQNKLASTYLKLKQIDKARGVWEFILSENPKYSAAWNNLGFIYLNMQNPQKAKEYYERAIALDPDYVSALLNMAGWHVYHQQYKEANKMLDRIIQKDSTNLQAIQIRDQLAKMN